MICMWNISAQSPVVSGCILSITITNTYIHMKAYIRYCIGRWRYLFTLTTHMLGDVFIRIESLFSNLHMKLSRVMSYNSNTYNG